MALPFLFVRFASTSYLTIVKVPVHDANREARVKACTARYDHTAPPMAIHIVLQCILKLRRRFGRIMEKEGPYFHPLFQAAFLHKRRSP